MKAYIGRLGKLDCLYTKKKRVLGDIRQLFSLFQGGPILSLPLQLSQRSSWLWFIFIYPVMTKAEDRRRRTFSQKTGTQTQDWISLKKWNISMSIKFKISLKFMNQNIMK